jgi:hypothetical protein
MLLVGFHVGLFVGLIEVGFLVVPFGNMTGDWDGEGVDTKVGGRVMFATAGAELSMQIPKGTRPPTKKEVNRKPIMDRLIMNHRRVIKRRTVSPWAGSRGIFVCFRRKIH